MIFNDLVVDIPAKKRLTKYGKTHSKIYVYEILARKGKDVEKRCRHLRGCCHR